MWGGGGGGEISLKTKTDMNPELVKNRRGKKLGERPGERNNRRARAK